MKKNNKVEELKNLFESSNIKLDESKVEGFLKTFTLMVEKKVDTEVKPLQEKVQDYQKRNHELKSKLEESNKSNVKLDESFKNLDKIISEKVKNLSEMTFPKTEDISKGIDKKLNSFKKSLTEKVEKVEAKLSESTIVLAENVKNMKDITINEDISKIGKVFNNYKEDFVNLITEKESSTIQELISEKEESKLEVNKLTEEVEQLKQELESSKEISEITMMIESSNSDDDQKEYLMSLYENTDFENAKKLITQFIKMNETKNEQRMNTQKIQMKETNVKKKTDMGIIKERTSDYNSKMNEWVDLTFKK